MRGVDHREELKPLFRGGPPWTTKLRLVLVVLLVIAFVAVLGAARGLASYVLMVVGEFVEGWTLCGRESERRFSKRASDEK